MLVWKNSSSIGARRTDHLKFAQMSGDCFWHYNRNLRIFIWNDLSPGYSFFSIPEKKTKESKNQGVLTVFLVQFPLEWWNRSENATNRKIIMLFLHRNGEQKYFSTPKKYFFSGVKKIIKNFRESIFSHHCVWFFFHLKFFYKWFFLISI